MMNKQVRVAGVFSTPLSSDSAADPSMARLLRRADDFTLLAVKAASGVLEKSLPLKADREDGLRETGIFLGSVTGPLETNFRFLDGLLDGGEGNSSPTLFSHSVHNAAAGYIARIHDIRGPAMTITKRTWPFIEALRTASGMIAAGRIECAVVAGVEQTSPLMLDAMRGLESGMETGGSDAGPDASPEGDGAVAWLLEKADATCDSDALFIGDIEILEESCDAPFFLLRTEEAWRASAGGVPVSDCAGTGKGLAMESVFALTEFLDALLEKRFVTDSPDLRWMVTARFGMSYVDIVKGGEFEV